VDRAGERTVLFPRARRKKEQTRRPRSAAHLARSRPSKEASSRRNARASHRVHIVRRISRCGDRAGALRYVPYGDLANHTFVEPSAASGIVCSL